MDIPDRTLLDRYLTGSDEAAFSALVSRYLGLVHAVALRVTGNEELARDVSQATFIRLAQRAALIPPDLSLTAWLHRIARGLAIDQVRAESRRKKRELGSTLTSAHMESSHPEPDWSSLSPVIDELVDRLPAADRDLLLLRYYRNLSHAAVAAHLGLSESVARKRAFRAVEKLRILLGKRGIATSATALATLLPAHASPAAPAMLSASMIQAVQGITPIVPHFFNSILITVTAAQKTALAGAVLLLLAATGYTLAPDPAASIGVASPTAAPPLGKSEQRSSERTQRARIARAGPEERLARLQEIMALPDPPERHSELIGYLDGLPANLLEETARILMDHPEDTGDEALQLVLSAWAKADPEAALSFIESQPGDNQRDHQRFILRDWGTMDPAAAIKWTTATANAPAEWREVFTSAVILGAARTSPQEVARLIDGIADNDLRETVFSQMVFEFKNDPVPLERILATATPPQKAIILGNLASESDDWLKGVAILNEHPEAIPFSAPERIYRQWVHHDPAEAIAAVTGMPAGELKRRAAAGLMEGTAYRDVGKAVELMELFPDAITNTLRVRLIDLVAKQDPARAMEEIPLIAEADQRNTVAVQQLKAWLAKDPAAAGKWIEDHPLPEAVLQQVPHDPETP